MSGQMHRKLLKCFAIILLYCCYLAHNDIFYISLLLGINKRPSSINNKTRALITQTNRKEELKRGEMSGFIVKAINQYVVSQETRTPPPKTDDVVICVS